MTDKVKAAIEIGLAVAKEYGENSWWEEYEIYKKEWKNYGSTECISASRESATADLRRPIKSAGWI